MIKKQLDFKLIILLIIALIVIGLLLIDFINAGNDTSYNMRITFFNVGRADAILIEVGDKAVMIDTGEDIHSEEIINYLFKRDIYELEYMILTHPDRDHIGGAADIINAMPVNNVIESTLERDTIHYRRLREATLTNEIEPIYLREIINFHINEVEFTVYPTILEQYEKSNDYSLIVSIKDGKNTFLFTGDAEEIRLNEFLNQGEFINHTFLKVPHHGVYNEASFKFLEAVEPTYAVITSTKNRVSNRDTKVLAWLNSYEVETYITGNGTIILYSDGVNICIFQ